MRRQGFFVRPRATCHVHVHVHDPALVPSAALPSAVLPFAAHLVASKATEETVRTGGSIERSSTTRPRREPSSTNTSTSTCHEHEHVHVAKAAR